MILRQEIEKIVCETICGSQHIDISYCKGRADKLYCPDCIKFADRICEAIGKAAEGMPQSKSVIYKEKIAEKETYRGAMVMRTECQAYWQKEIQ